MDESHTYKVHIHACEIDIVCNHYKIIIIIIIIITNPADNPLN